MQAEAYPKMSKNAVKILLDCHVNERKNYRQTYGDEYEPKM
jgi:hypothetical protein